MKLFVICSLIGMSIAAALALNPVNPSYMTNSLPVAVTETKQGLYREYTVETKTAEDKAVRKHMHFVFARFNIFDCLA